MAAAVLQHRALQCCRAGSCTRPWTGYGTTAGKDLLDQTRYQIRRLTKASEDVLSGGARALLQDGHRSLLLLLWAAAGVVRCGVTNAERW